MDETYETGETIDADDYGECEALELVRRGTSCDQAEGEEKYLRRLAL